MILTYKHLRDQFLRYLDEAGDTGTTLTLAGDLLNQAHQLRCTERNWPFMLWDTAETFSTVAAQQIYPLHQEFARPLYVYNRTTSNYLQEVPNRQLAESGHQWNTDTGSAQHFVLWGSTQVKTQPSSASVLTIVSSSASDVTSYTLIVRGVNASGVVVSETFTATGTTPVVGTTSFVKILSVTKSAVWNGRMTMTSNSGAVTNLTLEATEYGRSYPQLFLLASPDAVETIEYRFYRQPYVLTNDYDVPDIPPPYSAILTYDALLLYGAYDTGIASRHHEIWKHQRDRWEQALIETYLEGRNLAAKPRFVLDYQDEAWDVAY